MPLRQAQAGQSAECRLVGECSGLFRFVPLALGAARTAESLKRQVSSFKPFGLRRRRQGSAALRRYGTDRPTADAESRGVERSEEEPNKCGMENAASTGSAGSPQASSGQAECRMLLFNCFEAVG